MLMFYIPLLTILLITLYKRISSLTAAIKGSNYSKVKAELLFLSLIVVVSAFIVYTIERISK